MLNMNDQQAARERAVRFGWVSFFQDLGSKMVVPLLPLFLTLQLGAAPVVVGLVDGIGVATAAVAAPISARLTSKYRPVWLVRIGYGLSSIAKLALALASTWGLVLGVRVIDRLGKGVRGAPRDLLLVDSGTKEAGRSFGIQQAMDKFGGFLGPLVGLSVYAAAGDQFEPVFVVAFIPCAISVALLFRLPGAINVGPRSDQLDRSSTNEDFNGSRTGEQTKALILLSLHSLFFVSVALLLVRATEMGSGVAGILSAYAALRLVTAVTSLPAGILADRLGARLVVALAMVSSGGALILMSFGDSLVTVWLSLVMVGLAQAGTKGPAKAWLVSLGPKNTKAAVLGDYSAASGFAGLIGGVIVGLSWSADGAAPMLFFGVGCLAVAALTWVLGRSTPTSSELSELR